MFALPLGPTCWPRLALCAVLLAAAACAPSRAESPEDAAAVEATSTEPEGGAEPDGDAEPDGSERHAGYYYPPPETTETYIARATPLAGAVRRRRLGFVTALSAEMQGRPYPPDYVVFAKGAQSEKLIIVAVQQGRYDTIFRMRALLATLTAAARLTPLFQELEVDDVYTFFDLATMLGFRQITVSDGERFAHRIYLR